MESALVSLDSKDLCGSQLRGRRRIETTIGGHCHALGPLVVGVTFKGRQPSESRRSLPTRRSRDCGEEFISRFLSSDSHSDLPAGVIDRYGLTIVVEIVSERNPRAIAAGEGRGN